MKKVLITGGGGYIGSALALYLKDTYEITAITRRDFDLSDHKATLEWFQDKYFDVVVHTATMGGHRLISDGPEVLQNNLLMYYNLVDCQNHFDKLINLGSGAEQAAWTKPYGLSKRIIAESLQAIPRFYNLRIYGVFDELELPTRFIKGNILRYINEEPMIIHQHRYMDFIYMEDLLNLIIYYIENDHLPKNIDASYEEPTLLVEIANLINELDKHKVDIIIQDRSLGAAYTGDYKTLPISCIGLREGIKRTHHKIKQ